MAEKMDQLAVATNFLVMPLACLSGTFYSVEQLPEPFATAAHFNPFFHVIAAFRYAMTGFAETEPATSFAVLGGLALLLALLCRHAFAIGWRIKP